MNKYPHLKEMNILYVEDDEETLKVYTKILSKYSKNIKYTTNGKDALNIFQNNKIDIIISDINMPIMNGIKLAKSIKEINSNTPIFFTTAFNENKYLMESIDMGIDGYILKPIDTKKLLSKLEKSAKNITIQKIAIKQKKFLAQENIDMSIEMLKYLDELESKDKILMHQSKLASMGEMMDAMAHQMKQPLNAISLKNSLLEILNSNNQLTSKTIEETTKEIDTQIHHISRTIDEFRNFLRPNKRKENINVFETIESVISLTNDRIKNNSLQINNLTDKNLSIHVIKNEFIHILINLINNSIDAFIEKNIPQNSRVISFSSEIKDTNIIINVLDNAGGIPQSVITKIFEPNFTTKDESKGTGIGLYMCKLIIEKLNGKIEVSNKDDGVLFNIIIPS
jgi:C4-dicarboxylate-specific signal transduction histidine kinase